MSSWVRALSWARGVPLRWVTGASSRTEEASQRKSEAKRS